MMERYELKTKYFAGPIEKLLELIEEKKMNVTELSLSEVTADFLMYLANVKDMAPAMLADFIVVASRLLLIKSKALLPDLILAEEEKVELHDLEFRLLLYRECKLVAKKIGELWDFKHLEYGREFLISSQLGAFYPSPGLTTPRVQQTIKSLMQTIEALELREKRIITNALISIEQKMKDLMKHLASNHSPHFSALAKNKDEIIALFLAILHLLKDSLIEIEQNHIFSDIIITSADKR